MPDFLQCCKVRIFVYGVKEHKYSAGMLGAALIVGIGIGFCGGFVTVESSYRQQIGGRILQSESRAGGQ